MQTFKINIIIIDTQYKYRIYSNVYRIPHKNNLKNELRPTTIIIDEKDIINIIQLHKYK